MTTISPNLKFFLDLAKVQAVTARRFDRGLLGGVGFNEFAILFHLSQARGEKMRRADLAEKIGLTASGVTRLLAPMEKVGLIARESNPKDARVSYVMLASGGKRKLGETLEEAEYLAAEMAPSAKTKTFTDAAETLAELGRTGK